MKAIIIISKCSKIKLLNNDEIVCEFHFKGVYAGHVVKRILLKAAINHNIIKNEEYLLYVQLIRCNREVLEGKIIKVRLLSECWDKS